MHTQRFPNPIPIILRITEILDANITRLDLELNSKAIAYHIEPNSTLGAKIDIREQSFEFGNDACVLLISHSEACSSRFLATPSGLRSYCLQQPLDLTRLRPLPIKAIETEEFLQVWILELAE